MEIKELDLIEKRQTKGGKFPYVIKRTGMDVEIVIKNWEQINEFIKTTDITYNEIRQAFKLCVLLLWNEEKNHDND